MAPERKHEVWTPVASNSVKGTSCSPSFPGQKKKQKTEQLPLIHAFTTEQQPVPAPDGLSHALLMSHMLWACSSIDQWPRNTCLSNNQVQAPCRVPALQLVPFVSSWLSLVFTGNWHYYLLIAVMWQQWTYLQHVPGHLLQNIIPKAYNSILNNNFKAGVLGPFSRDG